MKKILLSAAVALAVGQAGVVAASESYTFTGPTTNSDFTYEGPGLLGGPYTLKYQGDAALDSLFIQDTYQYVYDEYDYYGNHVGGDDDPTEFDYFVLPGTKIFEATTSFPAIPADGKFVESTDPNCLICYTIYSYHPLSTGYSFYFATDPSTGNPIAGNFTFTISSIPEPKTWMMLMLGLGGVGFALRRWKSPAEVGVQEA